MARHPRLSSVEVQQNYTMLLVYENGERRLFDVKPYWDIGIFRELRDEKVFRTAHVSFGTVAWSNEADIEPEELYEDSVPWPIDASA